MSSQTLRRACGQSPRCLNSLLVPCWTSSPGFYGADCCLSLDAAGKPELLAGQGYVEVGRSVALPRLTPALVLHALDVFDEGEMDENAWFEWVKVWAIALPDAPATA